MIAVTPASMVTEDAFPALSDACSCGSWSRQGAENNAGSRLVRLVVSMRRPERLRLSTRKAHSTEGRSWRAGRTGPRPSTDTCERVGREFRGLYTRLRTASEQVVGRRRTRVPNPVYPVI